MVKKLIFVAFVLLSLLTVNAFGQTIIDKKAPITVAWDHDGIGTDHYEIQLIRDGSLTVYTYGTTNKEIVIPKPKSGVYTIQVRAVGLSSEGLPLYSPWCSSVTICAVNGPWKVRWKPGSVIGPIIISKRSKNE